MAPEGLKIGTTIPGFETLRYFRRLGGFNQGMLHMGRVRFEGVVVGYEEPPSGVGDDEYSMLLDGSITGGDGGVIHEGYFYVVAPRELYGKLDLGIGSNVSGAGELVEEGEQPVVRYVEG